MIDQNRYASMPRVNGGLPENGKEIGRVHVDENVKAFIDRRCQSMRVHQSKSTAPWIHENGTLPNRDMARSVSPPIRPMSNEPYRDPEPFSRPPSSRPPTQNDTYREQYPPYDPVSRPPSSHRAMSIIADENNRRAYPPRPAPQEFYRRPENKFKSLPVQPKPKKEKKDKGNIFIKPFKWLKGVVFGKKKKTETQGVGAGVADTLEEPKKLQRSSSLPKGLRLHRKPTRERPAPTEPPPPPQPPNQGSFLPPLPTSHSLNSNHQQHAHHPPPAPIKEFETVVVEQDEVMIPLQRGLPNLGNTCYWNAVLQCIAAVPPIATYYLDKHYEKALKVDKLTSLNYVFANLLEAMWQNYDGSDQLKQLRFLMERRNSVFARTSEEDAHEFLINFLIMLSKEMNTTRLDQNSNTAEVEGIFRHVFGANVIDEINCASCSTEGREKMHTMLFHCLSLPTKGQLVLNFNCVQPPKAANCRIIRHSVIHNKSGGFSGATKLMAHEVGIQDPSQMLVFQMNYSSFSQSLVTEHDLTRQRDINGGDALYITKLDPPSLCPSGHEIVTTIFIHTLSSPGGRRRMTEPFICKISLSARFIEIATTLLIASSPVVFGLDQNAIRSMTDKFRIYLHDDTADMGGYVQLDPSQQMPLVAMRAFRFMDEQTSITPKLPRYLRLIIEWRNPLPQILAPGRDSIGVTPSFQALNAFSNLTLYTLLKKHFAAEFVADWVCDCCKKSGGVKSCRLQRPPNILTLLIKRFGTERDGCVKLNTEICFPLERIDMGDFIDSGNPEPLAVVYDVVAILCHTGDLGHGHYVAYTRNPVDSSWRRYDDNLSTPISEDQVNRRNAYLIFLQRRNDRLEAMQTLKTRKTGFLRSFRSLRRNQVQKPPMPPPPSLDNDGSDFHRSSTLRRPASAAGSRRQQQSRMGQSTLQRSFPELNRSNDASTLPQRETHI